MRLEVTSAAPLCPIFARGPDSSQHLPYLIIANRPEEDYLCEVARSCPKMWCWCAAMKSSDRQGKAAPVGRRLHLTKMKFSC